MRVWRPGPGDADAVFAAAALFDHPPETAVVRRFLEDPDHVLFLADDDGVSLGFVSGVLMTHPDKGNEMFLYELAVDEASRRRGIATALVRALRDLAVECGCYGMWVLTDADNAAALATYARAGANDREDTVMFSWRFDRPPEAMTV